MSTNSSNLALFEDFTNDIKVNLKEIDKTITYTLTWTLETIYSQVKNGTIDLTPPYQRRNDWDDTKRSRLIESILLGYPIPNLILTTKNKSGKYWVVDGKQRLQTLVGFIDPDFLQSWNTPRLSNLLTLKELEGFTMENIQNSKIRASFENSALSTTIINTDDIDVLYDIFYRINTGSEPLTFQELRQALYRGDFSKYLIEVTSNITSFQKAMGLEKPDNRLNDVEMLLRLFANYFFRDQYKGSLKDFLDYTMQEINKHWNTYETKVREAFQEINLSIEKLEKVFGNTIAELPKQDRFNKALFEVQVYWFAKVEIGSITDENVDTFKEKFEIEFYSNNNAFRLGTNSSKSYHDRFEQFGQLVKKHFSLQ